MSRKPKSDSSTGDSDSRYITAIATLPQRGGVDSIIALCDDNTLWDGTWKRGIFGWTLLPNVPQGDSEICAPPSLL